MNTTQSSFPKCLFSSDVFADVAVFAASASYLRIKPNPIEVKSRIFSRDDVLVKLFFTTNNNGYHNFIKKLLVYSEN